MNWFWNEWTWNCSFEILLNEDRWNKNLGKYLFVNLDISAMYCLILKQISRFEFSMIESTTLHSFKVNDHWKIFKILKLHVISLKINCSGPLNNTLRNTWVKLDSVREDNLKMNIFASEFDNKLLTSKE